MDAIPEVFVVDPTLPGEVKLWRAVLAINLRDASMDGKRSIRTISEHDIEAAKSWIGSRYFREVCLMAELDPDAILDKLNNGGMERIADIKNQGRPQTPAPDN